MIEEEYPEKIIECMEKHFPKGDKRRGDALVLQAIAFIEGKEMKLKEVDKVIDDLDLELFLEDVVDKKTGKKVTIPKEIWELWNIYWEHIQEKLKQKLGIEVLRCV